MAQILLSLSSSRSLFYYENLRHGHAENVLEKEGENNVTFTKTRNSWEEKQIRKTKKTRKGRTEVVLAAKRVWQKEVGETKRMKEETAASEKVTKK